MSNMVSGCVENSLPSSPLALYLALSKGDLKPNSFWDSFHFRFKFFIRSIITPLKTYKLLLLITCHPVYNDLLKCQPRLPCRIHRPYLSATFTNNERLKAILYHYDFITHFLGPENLRNLVSPKGISLCQFAGKDGQIFTLDFVSTYKFDKEGEASIILRNSVGQMLAELTFVFLFFEGKRSLIIGGLQGPNNKNAQECVQQATKNLHGLFPKRIVLEALKKVSDIFKVECILAVSNKLHVYQSLRYKNRIKHMHADYDSFWEMSGGHINNHGFYVIPVHFIRKNLEEVPSKKRAEYRRRYELIDIISEQVRLTLSESSLGLH